MDIAEKLPAFWWRFLLWTGDKSEVLDIDNPDLTKFPEFSKATRHEGILEAGDILYIPGVCLSERMLSVVVCLLPTVFQESKRLSTERSKSFVSNCNLCKHLSSKHVLRSATDIASFTKVLLFLPFFQPCGFTTWLAWSSVWRSMCSGATWTRNSMTTKTHMGTKIWFQPLEPCRWELFNVAAGIWIQWTGFWVAWNYRKRQPFVYPLLQTETTSFTSRLMILTCCFLTVSGCG